MEQINGMMIVQVEGLSDGTTGAVNGEGAGGGNDDLADPLVNSACVIVGKRHCLIHCLQRLV
ncbi:MAG: hypothetical protein GY814_13060 [Gammaproteobacteria bacterium]|nr:hypothetical protein [Gammaproteobacteria bacterium]